MLTPVEAATPDALLKPIVMLEAFEVAAVPLPVDEATLMEDATGADEEPAIALVGVAVAETGHTVCKNAILARQVMGLGLVHTVYKAMVEVTMCVDSAGQFVTVAAHEVMVISAVV